MSTTMIKPASVGFGDLIRCMEGLGWETPGLAEQLAPLFNLVITPEAGQTPLTKLQEQPTTTKKIESDTEPAPEQDDDIINEDDYPSSNIAYLSLKREIDIPKGRTSPPKWLLNAKPLARPPKEEKIPSPTPLWSKQEAPYKIFESMALLLEEDRIDIELSSEILAQGITVDDQPRQYVRSLRLGVQVLEDWGKAMEPFSLDYTELRHSILETIGEERSEFLRFDGCNKTVLGTSSPSLIDT
jgi:hypothetical protein